MFETGSFSQAMESDVAAQARIYLQARICLQATALKLSGQASRETLLHIYPAM
jgi:hypothetical protein